jgi:shikimate kinase
MKSNITLIGMPGAGKSTIGIILAKNMGLGFIDTDVLIQINQQKTLQQIIDETDHLHLRAIESNEILKLNIDKHVIATGGSVVYSPEAMAHLRGISTIVFLDVTFEELEKRIHNFESRGIAKAADQTFRELFEERRILYKKYAEITVDGDAFDQEEMAIHIAEVVKTKQMAAAPDVNNGRLPSDAC